MTKTKRKNTSNTKNKSKKLTNLLDLSFKESIKYKNKMTPRSETIYFYIYLKKKYNIFNLLIYDNKNEIIEYDSLGYKHILPKYLGILFIHIYEQKAWLNNYSNQIDINKINNQILKLQNDFENKNGKRFLIIPVSYVLFKKSNHGHANLIIIDFLKKKLEYYEPYGWINWNEKKLSKLKLIKNIIKKLQIKQN